MRAPFPFLNVVLFKAAMVTLLMGSPVQAAVQAQPARIAVVVGNNVGMADEVELRYAEHDARKIERVLLDLGGYRDENVHLLLGADAQGLRSVLAEVARQTEARPGALVFFYYSGHADRRDLHLSGSRLALDEVRAFLDEAKADVRVALVDACKSGALIREKGAVVGPAFDIDVVQPPGVAGTIVITSSSDDEVSQESDRLGGSFFTHYWVSGLYGAADTDGDEQVTLEEAYRFAHFSTVSHTIASSGGVQHPKFELDLSGEGAIVMANLARSTARLQMVGGRTAGSWYVLDADRRFLLTEMVSGADAAKGFRLPPGRYRIKKREEDRVLIADVEVSAGEELTVEEADMDVASMQDNERKGAELNVVERVGLLEFSGHGPSVRIGARGMLFSSISPGPQVELGYRIAWKYAFVEPRLALFGGNRLDRPSVLFFEADLGSSVGLSLPLGPMQLAAGVDAGLVLPQQAALADYFGSQFWASPGGLVSVAVQGRGFGELAYELPGNILVSGRAWGGLSAYSLNNSLITPPSFGTSLGVMYRF